MGRTIEARATRQKQLRLITAAVLVAALVSASGLAAQAVAPSAALSTFEPGSRITLSGDSCSGETGSHHVIARLIGSSGSTLTTGESEANADGTWSVGMTLPSQIADGDYEVAFDCEVRDSGLVIGSTALESTTVSVMADEEPTPTPEPTNTPRPEPTPEPEPEPTNTPEPDDDPTPTPETGNKPLATKGTMAVSPSGGKAPLTITVSGDSCLDDDKRDTEVKLSVTGSGTESFTISVDSDGDWSKKIDFTDDDVGNNTIKASCVTTGGVALYDYDDLSVTIGASGNNNSSGSLKVNDNSIKVGDSIKVEADECPSDSTADADDFRVRFKLAYSGTDSSWSETKTGTADGKGGHTATIKVTSNAPVGTYNLTADCEKKVSGSWVGVSAYTKVEVTVAKAANATATPSSSPTAVPTPTPKTKPDIGFAG